MSTLSGLTFDEGTDAGRQPLLRLGHGTDQDMMLYPTDIVADPALKGHLLCACGGFIAGLLTLWILL